jgi:hypothetical protein
VSAVSAPYQPGQSPWPDNQSQRPDRPPPIQFQAEDQAPRGNPVLAWSLRVVGLIAIAAISGVVWWYVQNGDRSGAAVGYGGDTQQQGGVYDFKEKLASPKVDESCEDHAYDATKRFLEKHPCDRLTRSIFTTTNDGRTIYTSVSVVKMPDKDTAASLRRLVDRDGSGNISDLVREGEMNVNGLRSLSKGGGYASAQQGKQVVIVEADYSPKAGGGNEKELDAVCQDAIRLGSDIVANSG